MMKKATMIACILSLAAALQAEMQVVPTGNVSIMGGQYWVTGASPANFSGNADVFFSPAVIISPTQSLLPIYSGSYSGTKDVRELVGGGTLTREMQDHALSLKFIRKYDGGMKFKLRAGYKVEYLKETVDETWGNGLFDYQKPIIGVELEQAGNRWVARLGGDLYTMHYPNYQSLISDGAFEASIDTTTYSELSGRAGEDVLDYTGMAGFYEMGYAFSGSVQGTARYDIIRKDFKDEKIVTRSGEFADTLRQDTAHLLTLGVSLRAPKMIMGLTNAAQYYASNQNSFDMANSRFVGGYYGFFENAFMPDITFLLGGGDQPARLRLFWEIGLRAYFDRPAQYADGSYKNTKVTQTTNTAGCTVSYPLTSSLSAKFSTTYRDAASNMRYEKNYLYNYYTFNYFAGITWEL